MSLRDAIEARVGNGRDGYGLITYTELRQMLADSTDETDDYTELVMKQGAILTRVANALNGPPPPLTSWSHHDLGEKAEAFRDAVLEEAAKHLETSTEYGGAYGQHLRRPYGFAKAARELRTMKGTKE